MACLLIPRLRSGLAEGLAGDRERESVLWSLEAAVAASSAWLSLAFRLGVFGGGFGFGFGLSVSVFWPLKASVAPFRAALRAALALASGLVMEEARWCGRTGVQHWNTVDAEEVR